MNDNPETEFCVIGGGIAGLVFARQALGRSVVVLDDETNGDDGKSVVINAESANILNALSALPQSSRPLYRAHISFSGGGGGFVGEEEKAAPFAYGIDHKTAQTALQTDVQRWQTRATSIAPSAGATLITTADGRTIRAAQVVVACPLPFLPPPFSTRRYTYAQSVLSLTATSSDWPEGVAYQRFTRQGVLVLVPRPDRLVGVIISAPPRIAGELNAMSDDSLSAYLSGEFGLDLQTSGRRVAYSPQLVRARPLVADNISLLGSGATLLHPAGAQSIDLGIADACYLAQQAAAHTAPNANTRLPAHRTAIMLTSALALGAQCRALPFRLAGGIAMSLFGRQLIQKTLLTANRTAASFGDAAGGVRQ